MQSVIFIEPKIEDNKLYELFKKYNPDSIFVNPHICLVFPFKSELNIDYIIDNINKELNNFSSFKIKIGGISTSIEEKNNFVFIDVKDDNNYLKQISEILYSFLTPDAVLIGNFIPHITIGKSKTIDGINIIKEDVFSYNDKEIEILIDKITLGTLDVNEDNEITMKREYIYKLK